MTDPADKSARASEVPLGWFGTTLWKFTPFYLEMVFLAICLRLIGLVEPFVFQVIIDRILPFEREASLIVVIAIFAAVSVFQMGFEVLSQILGYLTANRVTRELGSRIYAHLFQLPFAHYRKWSVGETLARIGETDTIRAFLVGTSTGVFLDLLFVIVYIAVLFALSTQLTLIILAALPLQIMIYLGFGPFLRRRLRTQFDAGASHQSQMVENISGIAAVKALSAEDVMLSRLNQTLARTLDAGWRVAILGMISDKLMFVLDRAIRIAIIFFGAKLVFAGQLTLGELIAFHLLSEKVTGPIEGFAGLWESWQNIRVSRQRLGDILNQKTEPFGRLPVLPQAVNGALTFENVTFGYQPDVAVLRDFSFAAKPQSLTLVIGPSGAGKSTFGRLASGIEQPQQGLVRLDRNNIAEFDPHNVRQTVAYVPQEPYLFSGTIRDNLTIGTSDPDPTALTRALAIAAADQLVAGLPKGLDTDVGERGTALSGGQRQRIALARSILRNPKVLILDEPTSALDDTAQKRIVDALEELAKTLTIIVITHRPDIFRNPDQIVDFGAQP